MSLAEKFLAQAAGRDGGSVAALERQLEQLCRRAHDAWPGVVLPDEVFVMHLAAHVGDAEGLSAVHASDLFLACACAQGDARALAEFDRTFITPLGAQPFAARARFGPEAQQALRVRLLVPDGSGRARIASYTGRGPLAAWVRVAAARAAVDLHRARRGHAAEDGDHDDRTLLDPELEYLRTKYRPQFREAFQAVLEALTPGERNLLRLHFIEAVPADVIAGSFRMSRRTFYRTIERLRQKILDGTHRLLRERHGVEPADFAALLGLVQSQLDVSIVRLLGDHPDQETP